MERDFLGLSNKQVKEEVDDVGFTDLGYCGSAGVEWNKVYGLPNFMPHGAAEFQDVKVFPAAHQTASVSAANALLRNHCWGLAQNSGVFANPKPPMLGGFPITNPSSLLPTFNSFTGFMDPRNKAAFSGSPQLTIFYAGTVNVFDGVSPEKAQAIMMWAGNGCCMPSVMENKNQKGQHEEIRSKGKGINMYANGGGVSSPVSVSSSSSGTHPETADMPLPSQPINVVGSFCAAPNMIPSVPQARKASLARFLEKRKERLTNAMPYRLGKKQSIECSIGESTGMNYSATSAA